MATVAPGPTVRVEVGSQRAGKQKTYELQKVEIPQDPLSESPNFPAIAVGFWLARLLRPILLVAQFAGGPHEKDGVFSAAVAFNWFASITGVLGAAFISSSLRETAKQQGVSPWLTWRMEPAALFLLAVAVFFDLVHQLLATIGWKYFWSTGVKPAVGENEPLSLILVLLHIAGLTGLLGMVAGYGRCFRASWRKFDSGFPVGYVDDHWKPPASVDPEQGLNKPKPSFAAECLSSEEGPRKAAAATEQPQSAAPSVNSRPSGNNSVGSASSSPSSPRFWFWTESSKWVAVRIMRTLPDGAVVVRMPGGATVTTSRAFLRPRAAFDEQPPNRPPSPQSRGASKEFAAGARMPPSAQAGDHNKQEERRRSTSNTGPGSYEQPNKKVSERPSSAPPGPRQSENDSEGARWGAERLVCLRQELQALDGKPASERRAKLRALQRELHPDKQPPDLRSHAQPLFMLVQKEWELDEAAAKPVVANTTS